MKKIAILLIIVSLFSYPVFASNKNFDLKKKYVALSFDDGPSKYTNDIINYLYENDCQATFFVLGNKLSYYQDTLNNMISKNNEIANHTYSHPWLTHLNNNEILEEINKTQDLIINITGYTPKLFRPSYGDINKKLRNLIKLNIVLWTNDSSDWKYKSSKTIASNVIRHIKENDIILMHDTYKRTRDALKIIIPKLKELNYEVITISELLEIKELREIYRY
ncbi:MAG TPA: polysaccharide deacetylase family protein [Bacilli bacterium]|nr:polysaccharide deacetylase family protein [Bacilli bacterium]